MEIRSYANERILISEFCRSGYNSVWTFEETDEWLQTVKDGIVTACSRVGGDVDGNCIAFRVGQLRMEEN